MNWLRQNFFYMIDSSYPFQLKSFFDSSLKEFRQKQKQTIFPKTLFLFSNFVKAVLNRCKNFYSNIIHLSFILTLFVTKKMFKKYLSRRIWNLHIISKILLVCLYLIILTQYNYTDTKTVHGVKLKTNNVMNNCWRTEHETTKVPICRSKKR